jgi:diguanylate cyclase (GGDEF)-like protein
LINDRINAEILLVEDQRSVALSFAKALHDRWGCKVLIATTLDQVRKIITQKQHRFFLTISDLVLPDAPNGEVIDELIAAGYPTIAMTGVFDEKIHNPLIKKGVIDYVLKKSVKSYEYLVRLVGRLHRNARIKVLVVDDDRDIRELLKHMLTLQRLQVMTAKDGAEALQLLEQHPDIRLMFVDYVMPNLDGIELVAAIRNKYSIDELAVIGISGHDVPLLATKFLKVGANDFIAKPIDYDELVCRVSGSLDMLESVATIRHSAYHDYLTDVLNRRAFFELGGKLHDQAANEGRRITVAMLDIDHFKAVNDTHGHDGGDAVLRHFADLLSRHFDVDLIGRLGGEEFAMIIGGEPKLALERCDAFRERIAKEPAKAGVKSIPITVSIGVTHTLEANLDATIKRADENLYKAKAAGRNRVVAS